MEKKDKIKDMLGRGIPAANVADAVGVTPSYISQLMSDTNFAMEVAVLRTDDLTLAHDIDSKYDDYENRLLDRLGELIPLFSKPKDILEALRIINNAKRKSAGIPANLGIGAGRIISLSLPVTIINNYKINMVGGIVEVEGRSLRPMQSAALLKVLESRKDGKVANVEVIEHNPGNGGSNGEEPKLLEGINQKSRRTSTEISADSV